MSCLFLNAEQATVALHGAVLKEGDVNPVVGILLKQRLLDGQPGWRYA